MVQVNQYIDFNGKLLLVKRIFPEHKLNPHFNVNVMREWTRTDILLKKEGHLYCCEIIEEAEIISEERLG